MSLQRRRPRLGDLVEAVPPNPALPARLFAWDGERWFVIGADVSATIEDTDLWNRWQVVRRWHQEEVE